MLLYNLREFIANQKLCRKYVFVIIFNVWIQLKAMADLPNSRFDCCCNEEYEFFKLTSNDAGYYLMSYKSRVFDCCRNNEN
jgi:hypothetical protein